MALPQQANTTSDESLKTGTSQKSPVSSSSGVESLKKINPNKIDKEVLKFIPEDVARKYEMVAVGEEDGILHIAMVDPNDIDARNVLQFLAKDKEREYKIFSAGQDQVNSVLAQYESTEKALENVVQTLKSEREELESALRGRERETDNIGSLQDAPVAKLVEVIVRHAIDGKASDIHIEPIDKEYRVRFRVDGVLHSSLSLPKEVGRAVVARIKILTNLKIDEKRKPQDGRFRLEDGARRIDFRVSTLPVIEGEKVVMRVLDKESGLSDLQSLGLMGRNYEIFDRHIRDPYGIILMTGPTGSGKSTTLYAFLRILNQETTNIITLEDPVEYFIGGINQSQIKPEIGYTFANGLRSILRQDPNVIMVGEIRDSETAELAIHAALTGHLVFSTLHTNDAIGSLPRLIDMGIESFLLSASIRIVAAQRLVRRVCDKCKQVMDPPPGVMEKVEKALENLPREEFEKYGINPEEGLIFYEGKGCEACGQKGYRGRIAIYEVMEITPEIEEIISSEQGKTAITRAAKEQGMVTIKQDGILKALLGHTTLAEVERVTEGSLTVGGDMSDDVG